MLTDICGPLRFALTIQKVAPLLQYAPQGFAWLERLVRVAVEALEVVWLYAWVGSHNGRAVAQLPGFQLLYAYGLST